MAHVLRVCNPGMTPIRKIYLVFVGRGVNLRTRMALPTDGATPSDSPFCEVSGKEGSDNGCIISPISQDGLLFTFIRLARASNLADSLAPDASALDNVPYAVELPIRGGRQPPPCGSDGERLELSMRGRAEAGANDYN